MRTSLDKPPIFEADSNQPYARRVAIGWLVFGALMLGIVSFIFWYFIDGGRAPEPERVAASFAEIEPAAISSPEDEPAIKGYFTGEGMPADPARAADPAFPAGLSTQDILGSAVLDDAGRPTGTVHDIVVNPATGEARVVVANGDGFYDLALEDVDFQVRQAEEESVVQGVVNGTAETLPVFPQPPRQSSFTSLQNLRNGRVVDSSGLVAGRIDSVTYEDGQAREIIFYLDPELTGGIEEAFRIPFSGVTLVPREDSIDLHLDQAQTETLARWAAR